MFALCIRGRVHRSIEAQLGLFSWSPSIIPMVAAHGARGLGIKQGTGTLVNSTKKEARSIQVESVLVSWSGGKDCALALYDVLVSGEYQVVGALTTVTKDSDRVDMHDIRWSLIERQAQALGMPWEMVSISSHTSNADYEPNLVRTLRRYKESGVTSVVFGDIFREDLRKYRTLNLARLGMKAVFPLWKRDNAQLMADFITLGFKAIVTSINTCRLDDRFVGQTIDWQFMRDFPGSANICGEYGEYHTFVYDGPIFDRAVPYVVREVFERDDDFYHFKYCDLMPA